MAPGSRNTKSTPKGAGVGLRKSKPKGAGSVARAPRSRTQSAASSTQPAASSSQAQGGVLPSVPAQEADTGSELREVRAQIDSLRTLVEGLVSNVGPSLPASEPVRGIGAGLPTFHQDSATSSVSPLQPPPQSARLGLSAKTLESIRKGEFLEFDGLLSEVCTVHNPAGMGLPDEGEQQFSLAQNADATGWNLVKAKGQLKAVDFATWSVAWAAFSTVLCESRPELAPDLCAYLKTMAEAACTYKPGAWLAYDRSFRKLMAAGGHQSWAQICPDLWQTRMVSGGLSPFCMQCKRRHVKFPCVAPQPAQSSKSATQSNQRKTCLDFNRQRCFRAQCLFAHVCSTCNGQHPASQCPRATPKPQ